MEKINFYTQSSLNDTPELRMVIDVSGNVGIGEFNPTKALEVAGDISFNGDLYQNGTLFQSGGSGLTDLSATSISDLSDVSFNSTSTTQGNSLVWNNTDKVWESGTPTTSIVNTIDTQTNTPSWNQITTSGTVGTMTAYSDLLVYNDNGTDYLIFSIGWTGSVQSNKTYRYNISTSTWSELTTSNTLSARYASTAVIYNNNYYLFGGRISANLNETWKLDLTTNTWSQLSTTGTAPVARRYTNSDIYNGNLIIFGGYGSNALNDVWKLNLTTLAWTQLHDGTGTAPAARYIHSVNITGDNLYVFGGIIPGSAYNDTWKFDLTTNTWTQLSTSGTTPVARRVMDAIIYNNKLYIFGGINGSGTYINDLWELNLSTLTWTEIDDGTAPSARVEFRVALYNDKMYLFGGNTNNATLNDTWEFTLPQYTTTYNPVEINKLSTYYALSVGPNYDTSNMDNSGNLIVEGNVGIGLSDPSGYKLEVVGDISFNGNLYQNGSLFTGGSTIDETTDVSMNNTTIHGILDVSTNFTAGGRTSTTTTTSETIQWYTDQSNFTWSLTNDGTSTAPTARKNHSSIIDNSSNIVVFGGYDSTNSETNDVWKYNITNNTWSQLFTSTTPSDGTWDQITGSTATSIFEGATVYNNEIYVISDSNSKFEKYNPSTNTWTTLSNPSGASFYSYHQMVSYNGHIYLVDSVNGYRSVWDYNISTSTWSQISNTSDTSHDRYNAAIMVYNNNIYILGGRHIPYTGGFFNDIWKFNLTNNTWSEITGTTVTLDSNSSSMPSIAYSYFTSKDDNLYMFGGTNSTRSNKLYIYNVTNNTLTGYTTSISARDSGTASIQDNYLYLFGGYTGSNLNELIKYDLIAHTHTTISQSGTWPSARRDIQAKPVTIGNTFYLIGGYISGSITEIWRYTLDNTPNKLKHSSSVLNGDETVTIFGGSNGNVYYNSIYNFNLVSNSWSYSTVVNDSNASDIEHGNSSGAPSPRDGHTSVKYNNKMYMFGGKDGSTTYYDTWEYDLTSTTWTKKALAPSSYARYEHTSIIYNGDMYIFGGYDGTNYFNNILKYDITNDTWSEYNDGTTSGTPTARYGHISAIMQNEMIIFSGTTQSGHVEDSYMFNFVDSSWNLLDNDDSNRPTDSYSTTAEIQYYNPSDNHYKLFVFGGETPLTNKLYVADISRNNVTNTTSTTIPNILTFNSTNGRVGIGTNTPSKSLDVVGDGLFSGTVTANGSVLSSDDRIKHNDQPITNALSTISKITPKHYFKTGSTLYDATHNFPLNSQNQPLSASGSPLLLNKDYTLETGIIAQELRTIPELSFAVQNTTPLGVDYNSIHCTHIAATKELHQLVESQQTTLEEQQNEIEHLKLVNQDTNTQLNAALTELQTIKHYLGI